LKDEKPRVHADYEAIPMPVTLEGNGPNITRSGDECATKAM
jgi:hypothetical protein